MKLGVTGYGVVGRATADVLLRLGHSVAVQDTDREQVRAALAAGCLGSAEMADAAVNFVCVPETQLEDAVAALPIGPLPVIRSTILPGTTDSLSERFGRPLVYMPEFLREATAQLDALSPSFIIVGANEREHGELVAEIFGPLLVQILLVTPPIAEMVKVSLNAYLHTLISFWNEIHLICERLDLPSHVVGKICAQDPRVASYGAVMHGAPVGGRCLPKDIAQLIEFAQTLDYSPDLLKEVERVSAKVAGEELAAKAKTNGHNDGGPHLELLPRSAGLRQTW